MTAVCQIGDLGPGCLDLVGVRGGDRNLMYVNITDAGLPVNVTGMTFAAQARKKSTDPDPAAITADVSIADPLAGRLAVQWPGDQVTAVLNGSATWSGVWDLQQVLTPFPVTLIKGKFKAEADVTRP